MPGPANVFALPRPTTTSYRHLPTRDLLAEVEAARWLALEVADRADGSRAFVAHQMDAMLEELARRQRLLARNPGDPLAPRWPGRDRDLRDRVEAVKAAWPIERFVAELLLRPLTRRGPDSLWCLCPLPGHAEKTPSFHVTPSKGVGYCQGCHRGGDVIRLTQLVLGYERFYDALECLEHDGVLPERTA